ncbi:hypothetical protein LCGC14_2359310 [marine sediment metagenome]|uniref:Uncharacterized protein n=1 Tax=marine sediment metagenome TaxID=412755 RepID=A0A0F9C7A4_9ZZZZ
MTDEYTVYRILGEADGEYDVDLDFGMDAKHSELVEFRNSGREIHYRMYRVRKYGNKNYWIGPWKLDTPSEEQKKVIAVAGPYGVKLKVLATKNDFKRGWVFVKLKERFDSLIASHVYGTLYSGWYHVCRKRKRDNESMMLDADEKCRDCGMEKQDV